LDQRKQLQVKIDMKMCWELMIVCATDIVMVATHGLRVIRLSVEQDHMEFDLGPV